MKIKAQARRLFELSFGEDGGLSASRISAVCEYIDKEFPDALVRLRILRAYKKMVGVELEKESALIESAGVLSKSALSQIEEMILRKNRAAKIAQKTSPELLAGVRVTIGDEIFENSARQSLETGFLKKI